ncbi:MAG: hypothetical protein ABJX82_00195, partial [Paracoccaceae bacterium]
TKKQKNKGKRRKKTVMLPKVFGERYALDGSDNIMQLNVLIQLVSLTMEYGEGGQQEVLE